MWLSDRLIDDKTNGRDVLRYKFRWEKEVSLELKSKEVCWIKIRQWQSDNKYLQLIEIGLMLI